MKFLVDNACSPLLVEGLQQAGYQAEHVREHGLQDASDEEIFAFAAQQNLIVVSADTDFGTLLATRRASKPSVVLFRRAPQGGQTDKLLFYSKTWLHVKKRS